jgi:hypothetical protein
MMTQSPAPAVEFNFESACSSPYVTAPSSPQRFFGGGGSSYFYSAPASPARISATSSTTFSTFPLTDDAENPADFAFDFSGHLETPTTLSADELFYAGVIKPLQVPPQEPQRERGGQSSDVTPKNKSPNHKTSSRSLTSALRVSDILLDGSKESSSSAWYSKWSLMFRSKSEGSAAGAMKKKKWAAEKSEVDLKNASMRRKGMSSHELHYTENRTAAEKMRKKTPLPYKHAQQHGWLGCLGFSQPNFDAASSLLSRHHRHNSSY